MEPLNGISALINESPHCSLDVRTKREDSSLKPERGLSVEPGHVGTPILD